MKHLDPYPRLGDDARAMLDTAIGFAAEVMRPAGKALDALPDPEAVVSEPSPLWQVLRRHRALGLHRLTLPGGATESEVEVDPIVRPLVVEALGSGDAGLAVGLCTASIPFEAAATSTAGSLEALARAHAEDTRGAFVGCSISVPHESVDSSGADYRLKDHTAGAVVNGSIASHALLVCRSPDDRTSWAAVISLDQPGIARGTPLSAMGLRSLNRCEIRLADIAISSTSVIPGDRVAEKALASLHACVGQIALGLACAAFDESLAYARTRIQGGVPIVQHDHIKLKVFGMFSAIAAARALARSIVRSDPSDRSAPHLRHAVALRSVASRAALDIASEAIQIFGGPGLMKAYPVEKLLRDAGTLMTVNGTNDALALEALRDAQ